MKRMARVDARLTSRRQGGEVDRLVFSSGKDIVSEEDFSDAFGRVRTIRTHKRMFVGVGGRQVLVASFTDLTELRQAQRSLERVNQRLEILAHRDTLTGLPNRAAFEEMLVRTVAHARQNLDRFALLFMDLNGFKRFNDTYGHALGDKLISAVALEDMGRRLVKGQAPYTTTLRVSPWAR